MTVARRAVLPSMKLIPKIPAPRTSMIRLAFIALSALVVASCDKHSWDTTQKLHEPYNAHGGAAKQAGGHGTEAKTDAHAPKADATKH